MRFRLLAAAFFVGSSAIALTGAVNDATQWAQWRGPDMTGVSRTAKPPIEWSETKNLKWKVEIPGRGSSSPIVYGDRVYVLTAVPVGVTGDAQHAPRGAAPQRGVHQYKVLAIDRKTGKTVWERTAREEEPHEPAHGDNGTFASSSAITDGEHVIAYFESRGLYAYDMAASCCGRPTSATRKCAINSAKAQHPPCSATRSSSSGIISTSLRS